MACRRACLDVCYNEDRVCCGSFRAQIAARLVVLEPRDFFQAVDGFLLGSAGYYGWIFLAAAHADGILWTNHEACIYLPMIFMNFMQLVNLTRWAYRNLRARVDEDEDFGPLFALSYASLVIWNIFWLVLASPFTNSSLVVRFVPIWILPYGPPALIIAVVACFCPCACPWACYKFVTDDEFREEFEMDVLLYCLLVIFSFVDLFLCAFFVVLKAQGTVSWLWRYVFIPVWIMDVGLVILLLVVTVTMLAAVRSSFCILHPHEAILYKQQHH
jgi:hypothetical protein